MEGRPKVLARRGKTQPPPPWVIWDLLCDPLLSEDRPWFDVGDGEQQPMILSATKPHAVTWGSIWSDHPELTIEFQIEPCGPGSDLTWTLFGPDGCLDDEDVRRRRHRLNQLINGQLRYTFDQELEPEPVDLGAAGAHRLRLQELPAMVAAGIGLRHAYRTMAEDDAAYPSAVMLTDRSKLICDRAVELAKDRREDLDAVGDLTRLARGKTRNLKAAARSLRQFGQYQEDLIANRAYRLLEAAIAGTAVQPVSAHQAAVMDRLAELAGGSLQDHFAVLVDLEPRLAELADQACSGQFGRFPAMPEIIGASPEHLLAAAFAAKEILQRLQSVLVPLVGPEAESQDLVLRSVRAQVSATTYLEQLTSEYPPTSA